MSIGSCARVQILGRLTRDPELRHTQAGSPVANLGIAVNRKSKERKEAHFFRVVVWGSKAEVVSKYLRKGDPIFMFGRLEQERWKDRDGKDRSEVNIIMDDFEFVSTKSEAEGEYNSGVSRGPKHSEEPFEDTGSRELRDDEIPF